MDRTDDDVAARWNANADRWTEDVRAGADTYRDVFTWPAFADFAGDLAGLDAIDFGCGEGTNTRRMAAMGARMTGLDLSESLIGNARAVEDADPMGIDYHVGSYSGPMPFAAASFDRVLSTMALMDGPDLAGAMEQAYRILRPGGALVFSILHPCHISPGLRWERNADGGATGLVVDRYHDRAPFTEAWSFGGRTATGGTPFHVPRFPRTLADWLNAVTNAGFRLHRIAEPVPDAARAAGPRFDRWRDLAAFLLLVDARKDRD